MSVFFPLFKPITNNARILSKCVHTVLNDVTKPRIERQPPTANEMVKQHRFVDSVRVKFVGGRGGNGCISMLSEFCREFGGPDGGNGGNGGHVVLRANSQVKSLNKLARSYRGLPGVGGQGKNLYGKCAEHIFVDVPIGTMICKPHYLRTLPDDQYDPEESDVVGYLDEEDSMFIAARGGAGGRGNMSYLSNKNRHPRIAEAGADGEENVYEVRLQVYAHFGLIGTPNAGKSTLLKALTQANVKIGDYCFTTMYPQVGVISYDEDDFSQVAISDLPGLIDESNKHRGLGVRFLRHAQKCACLIYVIDLSTNPINQMETLTRELEEFRKGMSRRSHLIVGNKIDEPKAVENLSTFEKYLEAKWPQSKFLVVSSEGGKNLYQLRQEIKSKFDEYKSKSNDGLEQSLTW